MKARYKRLLNYDYRVKYNIDKKSCTIQYNGFSEAYDKFRELNCEIVAVSTDSKYGTIYKSRNIDNPDIINYFQWSPFNKDSDFYNHSKKEFMITYSVQNIEQLIENLRRKGITIVDNIKEYEGIGKIVHIYDCDGNYCELWEQLN